MEPDWTPGDLEARVDAMGGHCSTCIVHGKCGAESVQKEHSLGRLLEPTLRARLVRDCGKDVHRRSRRDRPASPTLVGATSAGVIAPDARKVLNPMRFRTGLKLVRGHVSDPSAFACSSGLTLCLSAQPPSRPVRARAPPPHDAPALRSRIARRLTSSHSLRATHRCLAPDICKKGLSTLT